MTKSELSMIVARNIQSLMDARGLNGVKLAERANLARTAVYDILKRRIRSPRIDTLEKIADALGVTIHELMVDRTDDSLRREIIALISSLPEPQRERVRDMVLGVVRTLPRGNKLQ